MNKNLKKDLIVFSLVFGILTIPFFLFDLDIVLQKPYYNPQKGWFLMNVFFWDFLYKYGIYLGYLLVFIALAVVSISYWNKNAVKWRKASYFILFVMIFGPGVLVNATFKEHWGRPRPREVKQFDGVENYIKPWVKGDTNGKSFPCGHASMGFILSIPFLFLRRRYKTWAWVFFIFGTLYGLLIGYARMVAGGHFASDVLWSAGMVWFAGIVGYYLLKVYEDIDESGFNKAAQKKRGRFVAIIMGVVVPFLTISLLLATPYISKKEFVANRNELNALNIDVLSADIPEGVVNIGFTDDLRLNFSVAAFGLPNGRVNICWLPSNAPNLSIKYLGWFTEVRNKIDIGFPENCNWENRFNLTEGKVFIDMPAPADSVSKNLNVIIQKGDVIIYVGHESNFSLITNNTEVENNSSVKLLNNDNALFKLKIDIDDGCLFIEDKTDKGNK